MKPVDVRDLTEDELDQRIEDTRRELFNLRIQRSTGQLENPLRIRLLRRDIARMLTIKAETTKASTS